MNIDQSQQNAIRHKDGPALVLAGPGSGKTLVITRRIQYLIGEYHIPPQNILVITFTRAAAAEMRQRFRYLTNQQSLPVMFGTFHAVYFTILKHAYGYTSDNIVREEQRVMFIKEYIHRLRLEYDDEADYIQSLLGEISLVKNTGIDLKHYYSSSCAEDIFRKIFEGYEQFLHQNHLIDFDDMLVYCKELLEQRPDILRAWQQKFQYILIDEFQDINQIQYDIIRMLALPQNNLFIVGDDDQSIYRFRGAKPEIMLNFETDYPGTVKMLLDTNYRSGMDIVEKSCNLVSHNLTRFEKDIIPAKKDGYAVMEQRFKNQKEQNLFLMKEISRLHQEENVDYHEMAVLFRTNIQPRYLMEQMLDYNIPFISKDRIPNIYDHWITQDIFTYIRLSLGDRSRGSFLRIMNRPIRYLSRESLPYESVSFDVWEEYYKDQDWMVQRLEKLSMDLNVIQRMRPFSAINYIRKGMAYEDFLRDYAIQRKIPEEDLFEILDELQENAKNFETFHDWQNHISKFQNELEQQTRQQSRKADGVNLCTLHSAKGLEYRVVFLIDVNEKIMPYKKAVLDADIEEERRIFYVGMTRAKERLYLFSSGQIHNKEMEPSRFLSEYKIRHRISNDRV